MTINELSSLPGLQNELIHLQMQYNKHCDANFYKKNIITDMPRGGEGKDQAEWWVAEKMRLDKEIARKEDEIQEVRKKVYNFVNKIENKTLRDIVMFRCINGLTYAQIGDVIGYSRSRVWTIFNDFFEDFNEIQNK